MTLQLLPFWEAASEGLSILLGGIIIFFLIFNKIKYKRMILKTFHKENSQAFSSEMLTQYLRQQTDRTFDSILQYIHRERQLLENSYLSDGPRICRNPFIPGLADRIQRIDPYEKKGDWKPDGKDYAEIIALHNKGLSSKTISKNLNIPRGEVELNLRINHIFERSVSKKLLRAKA